QKRIDQTEREGPKFGTARPPNHPVVDPGNVSDAGNLRTVGIPGDADDAPAVGPVVRVVEDMHASIRTAGADAEMAAVGKADELLAGIDNAGGQPSDHDYAERDRRHGDREVEKTCDHGGITIQSPTQPCGERLRRNPWERSGFCGGDWVTSRNSRI